jgi:excisionase family DNA binding protein
VEQGIVSKNGRLYSVPATAEILQLKEPTIRKWLLLRKLAYHKVGGRVLIPESEIQRILEQGYVPALVEQR